MEDTYCLNVHFISLEMLCPLSVVLVFQSSWCAIRFTPVSEETDGGRRRTVSVASRVLEGPKFSESYPCCQLGSNVKKI